MTNKKLFLLGGQDLEMETIRLLLLDYGYVDITDSKDLNQDKAFADKKTPWGPQLSIYEEFLSYAGSIYGIELTEDIPVDDLQGKYIKIDHHNEFFKEPPSITQVAKILNSEVFDKRLPPDSNIANKAKNLGCTINEYLNIIATNDCAHIRGLRGLKINEGTILNIRMADRTVQGITQDDWSKGSICVGNPEYDRKIKDVRIIQSKTPYFSVITDRIDEEKLIIYNDTSLCYYGQTPTVLLDIFEKQTKENKTFYGGSEYYGYFGLKKEVFVGSNKDSTITTGEAILKIVEKISKPFSYHIFIFPFQWDYKGEDITREIFDQEYTERTDLSNIKSIMKKCTTEIPDEKTEKHCRWKEYNFKIEMPEHFNEYNYFYNHVREALFAKEMTDSNKETKSLLQYNYILPNEELFYVIELASNDKFELKIEDINLNFYDSGIGLFAYHLANYKYDKPDDILAINDFGRRIYPPFLGEKESPIKQVQGTCLAKSIQLKTTEDFIPKENFDHYKNISNLKEKKIVLPSHIGNLLGTDFDTKLQNKDTNKVQIRPIIDDRMFVLAWYGNKDIASQLSNNELSENKNRYNYDYERNKFWNKYIFVDNKDPNLASKNMLRKLNLQHTYDRWVDWNTLYGISRYSFVLITNTGTFAKNVLLKHLQTSYYQMVMLALAQRASVLRFSIEVTSLSSLQKDKECKSDIVNHKHLLNNVTKLHEKYIRFVNKMHFREVTAQEQGIELYEMLTSKMRLNNEVKDLNNEIDELFQYTKLIADKKEADTLSKIQYWGAALMVAGLIISFFGINAFNDWFCLSEPKPKYYNWLIIFWLLFVLMLTFGAALLTYRRIKNKTK